MRELRLVLLGLAAVIAIVLGVGFLRRALLPHAAPQEPSQEVPSQAGAEQSGAGGAQTAARDAGSPGGDAATRRGAIERAIADTPEYRSFFDKLRAAFPDDHATILANEASAMPPGRVDVDAATADAVTALRRAHGALAAKAPDPALAAIFAQQQREMEAMEQRDPHLCVAFLYGTNGSGFLAFAAGNRALVADAAIAGLDAMIAGAAQPVTRAAGSTGWRST